MSKIIKIDSCKKCPHMDSWFTYHYCFELHRIKQSTLKQLVDCEEFKIKEFSKILPNCPLEDYPEVRECIKE